MSELINISVSRLTSFKSCRKRYFFSYVNKLQGKTRSLALTAGSNVHQLIEQLYNKEPVDVKELTEKGIAGYNAYGAYAQIFDDFKVLHTEYKFEEPIEDKFLFRGAIDGIVERDGEHWVMEHKTGGKFWSEKRIALDEQTPLYELIANEQLNLQVAGTLRNFIRLTERKGSWHGEVKRQYIPTSPEKQVEVFNNMVDTAVEMAEALDKYERIGERAFPRNPGEQCAWCDFFMLCEIAYSGGDQEYAKEHYFDRNTRDDAVPVEE